MCFVIVVVVVGGGGVVENALRCMCFVIVVSVIENVFRKMLYDVCVL
jgi:hypothetical protein